MSCAIASAASPRPGARSGPTSNRLLAQGQPPARDPAHAGREGHRPPGRLRGRVLPGALGCDAAGARSSSRARPSRRRSSTAPPPTARCHRRHAGRAAPARSRGRDPRGRARVLPGVGPARATSASPWPSLDGAAAGRGPRAAACRGAIETSAMGTPKWLVPWPTPGRHTRTPTRVTPAAASRRSSASVSTTTSAPSAAARSSSAGGLAGPWTTIERPSRPQPSAPGSTRPRRPPGGRCPSRPACAGSRAGGWPCASRRSRRRATPRARPLRSCADDRGRRRGSSAIEAIRAQPADPRRSSLIGDSTPGKVTRGVQARTSTGEPPEPVSGASPVGSQ